MAFEGLSTKLQNIFKKLGNKGKLTEKEVKEALREVRLALLEADVNYTVVKKFVNQVTERAVGSEVLESLTPAQQVIKIVNEELTKLMGGTAARLDYGSRKPSVFLLSGLQGAGKTTMAGKLAVYLKKHQSKDTLLVACDVYRPAAVKQLQIVGEKAGVPVFERGQSDPVETAKLAVEYAERNFIDVVIIDTAGRLHIDEAMMDEIAAIKEVTDPSEILLVVDAMTGQDAVNVAKSFHDKLGLTGVILTKLDGDTRGGAALSVKEVTGQPIKFSGTGEKLTDIAIFHPDRMASRILGMGDMLSLIEKAEQAFDEKKANELAQKLRKDEFTLDDFLDQFQQVKNMGSLEDLVGMIPGLNASKLKGAQVDTKAIGRTEAIIRSMTPAERNKPDLLNASRKRRIAKGSGTSVQEVNRLLNQFEQTRQMMKQFTGGKFRKGKKPRKGFFGF
ncbi:MAG: signal recognition particle protein [Clostridia bacterium]|nr:signal recognition particle protein [Clostridia bacterium]